MSVARRGFWISITATLLLIWLVLPASVIKPKTITLPIIKTTIRVAREPVLGLDLRGGSRLVFSVDTSKIPSSKKADTLSVARDIIERRVNFFGVSEPNISVLQRGSVHTIAVELPGVAKPEEVVKRIGRTAQLRFMEYREQQVTEGTQTATIATFVDTPLTGAYLKKSSLVFDSQNGKPQVSLEFDAQGTKLFADITKKSVGKPLAISLDGQMITNPPIVQQEITNGNAVISGDFSVTEAKNLVKDLNGGALPAPVKLIEQSSIEPTVGADNVRRSVVAGLVGIASVALFMVLVYRINGLYSLVSLFLYALISVFLYQYSGIVLTLSGIAGLLLSIGMAVDSNILIYERIKEEETQQKDKKIALRIGFEKALGAIKEANSNTLLIAFILFNPFNFTFLPLFGSVRGFAATLAIGVLVSLFTGVFVTKNLLWWAYGIGKGGATRD